MIVKAAALLMGLQVLTQLTGLMKQVLVAAQFGTSETMDGYLVAVAIGGLIVLWVRLPIRQTLLPIFRYDMAQRGDQVAWANFSVLFNNLTFVIIFVALTAGLLAPYLVALIAPGFEKGTGALATSLTQIIMVSVIFVGMAGVLSQVFLSYERFFVPGIVGSVNNVVVMLGLLALGSTYGIYGLATAVVLGAVSQFAFHLPILWEKRKFYSHSVNLRHPGMLEMGKLSLPLLISTGGRELARVTDRIFASLLPVGSLSSLAYAHRLITVPFEFFIRPLQKPTFPHFTKLCAEQDFRTLSRQLFHYLRVVSYLVLPMAIGIMVLAETIVRLFYQRGAFDETSTRLTSQALIFYAIGLPAVPINRILTRTLFGMKDTWTPTKIALLRMGIKIGLSWILIQPLAHRGIALAESVSQITSACLLLFFLPDKVKGQQGWITAKSIGQTLAASLLMLAVVSFTKGKLVGLFSIPLELGALVFLGVITYGAITLLLRADEIRSLLQALAALLGKSSSAKI